ncbi:CAP Gly-rich domain-containing protein [Dipodascopsis uninucleata]
MDVVLNVTSDQISSERRISMGWTVATLKSRLEAITGVPVAHQKIDLYVGHLETPALSFLPGVDSDNTELAAFADKIQPYARLHVTDTRPPGLQANYTDVSEVKKFELSSEEYSARNDTVLAWKKRNKLGRFAELPTSTDPVESIEHLHSNGYVVGNRCRAEGTTDRRGVIKYVGKVPEISGSMDTIWIGIEFDEPVGKNDGSIKGQRYFQAKQNYGSFLRSAKLIPGDFPPIDEFEDSEEEL